MNEIPAIDLELKSRTSKKIDFDFGVILVGEEQLFHLQIAMQNAVVLQIFHAFQDVLHSQSN